MKRTCLVFVAAFSLLMTLAGCSAISYVNSLSITDDVVLAEKGKSSPPLWKLDLGVAFIEEMFPMDEGRIFVSTRKDDTKLSNEDYLLVDSRAGHVLWRYDRDGRPGEYVMIMAFKDRLAFRVNHEDRSTLVVIDTGSGKEKWAAEFSASAMFLPLTAEDSVLAVEVQEGKAGLSALSLNTGKVIWRNDYKTGHDTAEAAMPVIGIDGIYHFYNGVEKLSPGDGKSIWQEGGVFVSGSAPPPQLDGRWLYAVSSNGALKVLEARGGRQVFTSPLEPGVKYTNIYPYGRQIYLRGHMEGSPTGPFNIYALDKKKGAKKWRYSGKSITVSNLLEKKGRVFVATPTTLIALDARTGKKLFSRVASETGLAYPVHLKESGGRIVFISELIVAAFDPATGKEIYSYGISPLGGLYLYGLDITIKSFKTHAANRPQAGPSMAQYHMDASARYQNQANHYYKVARQSRASGDSMGYQRAVLSGDIDSAFSRAESQMAFHAAMSELGKAINDMYVQMYDEANIRRQNFLRRTIVSSYNASENNTYVYRPYVDGYFSGVQVVHMPTGKRTRTVLSPEYLIYGFWSLIDFDKGVVYHHGLGLDPAGYVMDDFAYSSRMLREKSYRSYLIAQPLQIPR